MKNQLNGLLSKRMDRKEFLKHVAMGFAVLTGVAGVVKALKPQQSASGYGSSAYGGSKDALKA